MLDVLRKRKRSWIITFLLGLIIIVFIAFYGGNKLGDERSQDVAEVNGELITQREFAIHYQRALERYRDMLKGSLTPELEKSLNLRGTLLEEENIMVISLMSTQGATFPEAIVDTMTFGRP